MLSILAQRPVRKTRQTIWLICEKKKKTSGLVLISPRLGPTYVKDTQ